MTQSWTFLTCCIFTMSSSPWVGETRSSALSFLFILVLGICTVVFMGNSSIVLLIYLDAHLHIPMYFLLSQLSLMDLMFICTTIDKMAFNYFSGRKSISLSGFETKIFFYMSLMGGECFLLASKVYELYVAICHPLRYPVLMNPKNLWPQGYCFLGPWLPLWYNLRCSCSVLFILWFVGITHFFCDVPALFTLTCMDTLTLERIMFFYHIILLLFPVAIIIAPYACVNLAVICMGSREGHHKAFATCSSHLMVVFMYYGAAMFTYKWSISDQSPTQDKMALAYYTILTPILKPFIYSLHNREVSEHS